MRQFHCVMAISAILLTFTPVAHAQNAADAHFPPQEMESARMALKHGVGGAKHSFLQADRFEYQTGEGDALLFWDAQGWYGGDINRLWIKSEGEYALEPDTFEEAEVQALWSHAISPYFDVQAGIRHDLDPDPSRTYGVIGLQGLAPYQFEVDTAAFVSEKGDVSARIEAEYEFLLTQRVILQPRAELGLAAQDVADLGLGSGITNAEAGLRLRYEIKREFAPYIGVSWRRSFGDTANFARAAGDAVETTSFIIGLRLWY